MTSEPEGVSLERTVGEVVAEDFARAAVFAEFGIDFCCGGDRPLAQACAEAGVAPDALRKALAAVGPADPSRPDPRGWSLGRLANHIEQVHHAYVRRTLPRLRQWTAKISEVHGRRHPELLEIERLVGQLGEELHAHMSDEETRLFPQVATLDARAESGGSDPAAAGAGVLVEALEDDHERAGDLTRRIRTLANDFVPPADACSTYAATYTLLQEFEADLHRHVHLENNILFPQARARQGRRTPMTTNESSRHGSSPRRRRSDSC